MTDEQILSTADACGMMLFGLGMDKAKFEFCILAFAKQILKLESQDHIEQHLIWAKQLSAAQRNELSQIEDGTWEADRNG